MGRFYRIEIQPAQAAQASNNPVSPSAFGTTQAPSTLSGALGLLFPIDSTGNTSAYQIEFDLSLNSNGSLGSGARILTIHGIDPKVISQAANLNFSTVTIYGGFDKGMPLSTLMAPLSTQPILQGVVYGAFGNWIGTELYLCLPIVSLVGYRQSKPNLTLSGPEGMPLKTAIMNALNVAFPGQTYTIDISDNLVLQHESNQGVFGSIEDFSDALYQESRRQLGASIPNYQGIKMGWKGATLLISDKTTPTGSKTINITPAQLMGNPVWVDVMTLQIMCPMRSDIQLFDTVTLPATPQIQTGASATAYSTTAPQFTGNYQVIEIRHVGNSRSADALAWATVLTLVATPITSTNKNSQIGATTPSLSPTTGSGAPIAFGS